MPHRQHDYSKAILLTSDTEVDLTTAVAHLQEQGYQLTRVDDANDQTTYHITKPPDPNISPLHMRNLVNAMTDIVFMLDRQQRHTGVFGRWLQDETVSADMFIGKTARMIMGDEAAIVHETANERALTGEIVTYEWQPDPDHYIQTILSPLYDEKNEIVGLVGMGRDITDLKQTEFKLRESERRYRQMFEANQAIKLIIDPEDGRIITANEAACKFYGYSLAELTAMRINDINCLPEEDVDAGLQQAKGKDNLYFNFKHRLASGEIKDVEVYTGPVETADGTFLYSIIHDITKRNVIANDLHIKDLAIASTISAVAITDLDGYLTYVNQAFLNMWGYDDKSEVLGQLTTTFWHDEVDATAVLQSLMSNSAWLGRLVGLRKDGTTFHTQLSASVIYNEDGDPLRFMASFIDITTQKYIEDALYYVAQRGWAINSESFFSSLVQYLAETLQVDYAYIGELVPRGNRIRTVSLFAHGQLTDNIEYDLQNTPCADVTSQTFCCHQQDIQKLYPQDDLLKEMHITGYAGIPLWNSQGESLGIVVLLSETPIKNIPLIEGVLQVIAVRAAHELERWRSNIQVQQLSRAIEQSPISVVITDTNGQIEYVNPKFTQVTGYSYEEALGQNPNILRSGRATQKEYEELWNTILQGKEWHGEFYNRTKSGEYYWEAASISPVFNEKKEITSFLALKEDITNRKKIEEELQQRNYELLFINRIAQTLNSSLELEKILSILVEDTYQLFDVSLCAIWQLEHEYDELVCVHITSNLIKEKHLGLRWPSNMGLVGWVATHQTSLIVDDALVDNRYINSMPELELRSFLSVPIFIKQSLFGIFQVADRSIGRFSGSEKHIVESLAIIAANAIENAYLHEDLQQQLVMLQKAQARLVQSEKLAGIGQLIAGVAHELNNPLASTMLYAQLLQTKNIDPLMNQDLEQIVVQARRASNVVRGLLDFARQHPPEQVKTQVNDLLNSTIELLAYELRTNNISVYTQLDPHLPVTLADPHQLQQVFVNLITNARQAISAHQEAGNLTLVTETGPSLFLQYLPVEKKVVRIMIKDDGPGMPDEVAMHIFDPFFTTKVVGEGTGLGLSICHGIISEHDGHIWAESTIGVGSIFFIELPIVKADGLTKTTAVAKNQGIVETNKRQRILVVDDEISVLNILIRLLGRKGHQVDGAKNGLDALQLLEQNEYNLILTDLRMPDMGGIKLYNQIAEKFPVYMDRIIFTTGDTVNMQTRLFLDKVQATYLSKPFELDILLETVQQILDSPEN